MIHRDPPPHGAWLSEIKFDGYRLVASVKNGFVRLLTRNGLDIADLGLRSAMLDGELVALQPDGVFSCPMLQAALFAAPAA